VKSSARLQTNLVGRKVHLLTDEECREDARRQYESNPSSIINPDEIATITVKRWWPALADAKYRSAHGTTGEIVAVHLNKDHALEYTIAFGSELFCLPSMWWRLGPHPADAGSTN
jgi:hypothetical protein